MNEDRQHIIENRLNHLDKTCGFDTNEENIVSTIVITKNNDFQKVLKKLL